jgi:hypothetical protein
VPDRERILLIVEVDRDVAVPLPIRLRRVLKSLLRAHGVRCLWLQSADAWAFGSEIKPAVNLLGDEERKPA